jgi:hypothetical protein
MEKIPVLNTRVEVLMTMARLQEASKQWGESTIFDEGTADVSLGELGVLPDSPYSSNTFIATFGDVKGLVSCIVSSN